MLTCRLFRNVLHPRNNARLYRRIFAYKFDYDPFARRSPPLCSFPFFPELKRRFHALRCIKQGDIHHPALQDAFLVAYVMVLEHDTLNHRHLQDAGLHALLHKYITRRLQSGHNVWPIEDACNTLAVALFWHMTSQGACACTIAALHLFSLGSDNASLPDLLPLSDSLNEESSETRETIIDILLPLSFAWFRVRPSSSSPALPFLCRSCFPSTSHHFPGCSTRL